MHFAFFLMILCA